MIEYCDEYWDDVAKVVDHIPYVTKLWNKTILITGATGMVCSAVAEILLFLNKQRNAGINIILAGRDREKLLDRFYCFEEGSDYHFYPYDATSIKEIKVNTDYIIHGASNAYPAIYTKEPVETMLSNIVGLNTLLSSAVRFGTKRVLYVSSSEVYGNKDNLLPYGENDYGFVDILNQRASYPSAKRAAETMCIAYSEEYHLDTVIVRPGHIYGPSISSKDTRASAEFTRNAHNGEDIIMKSAGAQLRSYCYTLDCGSAILAVLTVGETENAYNISNKDSIVSISEIAKALAAAAGTKVIIETPSEQEAKGFNLMSNSSLYSEKLEALGWNAVFSLSEGVTRTLKYYKD